MAWFRLVFASWLMLLSFPISAEDWPAFRGPHGDGVSSVKSAPLVWSETQNLAWKLQIPDGASSPIVWNDSVFVTAQDGRQLVLYRIERAKGVIVWRTVIDESEPERMPLQGKKGNERLRQKFHKLHNLASPTPATDGKVIITHFGNGMLACLDYSGKILWRANLQEISPYSIWWGHSNSPVIWNELVVSVCMQDSCSDIVQQGESLRASYIVAHDLRTGQQRWRTNRMNNSQGEYCDSYTTPVLYSSNPERPELIVMGAQQLDSYDPRTGQQLWGLSGLRGNRVITNPVIHGHTVYATRGMRGPIFAFRMQDQLSNPLRGNLDESSIAWQHEKNTPDSPSPVVSGGYVFLINDQGIAQCLDVKTGLVKWEHRIAGDFKASPVAVAGRIYFQNMSGVCTIIEAGPKYKKVGENKLDDEFLASPAIVDDLMILRGRKMLYGVKVDER